MRLFHSVVIREKPPSKRCHIGSNWGKCEIDNATGGNGYAWWTHILLCKFYAFIEIAVGFDDEGGVLRSEISLINILKIWSVVYSYQTQLMLNDYGIWEKRISLKITDIFMKFSVLVEASQFVDEGDIQDNEFLAYQTGISINSIGARKCHLTWGGVRGPSCVTSVWWFWRHFRHFDVIFTSVSAWRFNIKRGMEQNISWSKKCS